MRRTAITAACLAGVLLVGWADLATGPDLGLSLIYLVPIAIAAWFTSTIGGVAVAALAGAAWFVTDVLSRTTVLTAVAGWNAFNRVVIFLSVGLLIRLVKVDREKLKRIADREAALARSDFTTSLANVRGFLEAAEAARLRMTAEGRPLAAIYFDLDNFKPFNDLLGHAAGDDILVEVANTVRQHVSEGRCAARIGGDEFALLLPGASVEDTRRIAESVIEAVRRFGQAYPDLRFGVTAGIAFFESAPPDADTLLRCADDAMYEGKRKGKGAVSIAFFR